MREEAEISEDTLMKLTKKKKRVRKDIKIALQ